ncbi:MAG: hypothetical protein KBT27_11465 [Prevotellaceae bacterium]|nr:hypothetical protein [Candidatus Faecinaster equi]
MNRIILLLAVLLALCSGCKTTQTLTSTDTEQTHVTVYDTTRVVNTVMVVDTAHTEFYHTSTTHTVEYYDPETGQLRQRVIDQQCDIRMLQAQLLSMQMVLDSINAHMADTTHTDTHVEVDEVVETQTLNDILLKMFFCCLFGMALGIGIIVLSRRL